MTDRELLELAAKAAGIEGRYESWTGQGFNEGIRPTGNPKEFKAWNPLRHDDQAFRLAVKLKLLIDGCSNCAQTMEQDFGWFYGESGDEYAQTRRAIVRAAAEIGKAMK